MDRTNELKNDYEQMAGLVEKFEKRQALKVEGDWYVLEQEGEIPKIIRGIAEGILAGANSADGILVEIPCAISKAEEMGWTVTPVKIFRER